MTHPAFISVTRGTAPLVVSLPHTGTDIPDEIAGDLVSHWIARKDCDWWIEKLYDFAAGLGASVVRTSVSRTAIDVNRDPSGVSLYPGQATTELCPTTTFDGEPLYKAGKATGRRGAQGGAISSPITPRCRPRSSTPARVARHGGAL